MVTVNTTIKKKKRVSKKSKLSWRKHTKVKDVEEFLENKRLDERFGLSADSKLGAAFVIDTQKSGKNEILSKHKKRIDAALKPVKCFQNLESKSSVQDPVIKRNRVRTKEERRHPIAKKKDEQRKLLGIVKKKDILANENRKRDLRKKKLQKPKRGVFSQDIWSTDSAQPGNESISTNEWLNNNTVRHNLVVEGVTRKTIPKSIRKKNYVVPAVEPPYPGMSYNPSLEDHQKLLTAIARKEEEEIKKEQHLKRVTTDRFSKVPRYKQEKSWLEEMSQGLPTPVKTEKSDSDSDDNEYSTVNPPVENKKKDRKQRRKQKEQLLLEQERQKAKVEKKKIADIHKLRFLEKHLSKKEEKEKRLRDKRERVKALKSSQPKKLNANKFEEPDLEFNMGEDISGNLRNLKSEGNLLRDRYKSLQKRNVLEVTKLQMRKKAKVKKFERAHYKMEAKGKGS